MAFLALTGVGLLPELTSSLGLTPYIEQIPVVGAGFNTALNALSSLNPFNAISSLVGSFTGSKTGGIDTTTILILAGGGILVLVLLLK